MGKRGKWRLKMGRIWEGRGKAEKCGGIKEGKGVKKGTRGKRP